MSRSSPSRPWSLLLTVFVASAVVADSLGQDPLGQDALEHFENHVRPVFVEHCVKCHGGETPKGGLSLDTAIGIRRGAMGVPIVLAGDVDASPLIEAIRHDDPLFAMPPSGKLPDDAIAALERWVEMGAVFPDDHQVEASDLVPWNLVPPAELPAAILERADSEGNGAQRDWIDVALEARLEAAGIEPSPPASKESWLRRVTFDLSGLPPTPEEWRAYMATDGDRASRAAVVDRLLASPAHAERWARRWLDLVRYAESRAHEFDYSIPNAFQYRDYVIRAFEADVPYDRFITELLAGDLVTEPRLDPTGAFDESILGTGAWFLGEAVHSPVELRADQCGRIAHQVEVLSKSVLAMGVACARCHDHKFDPISAEDYHAFAGFALSTGARQMRFETDRQNRALASELHAFLEEIQPRSTAAVASALEAEAEGLATLLVRQAGAVENGALDRRELTWSELLRRDTEGAAGSPVTWFLDPPTLEPDSEGQGASPPFVRTLVDFGQLEEHRWITNGPGFGPGPLAPGAIVLDLEDDDRAGAGATAGAVAVVRSIVREGSAVAHPLWNGLQLRSDAMGSSGGSMDWQQAGRTILSPTFESEHGRVAYLVRGQARVLMVVDGYRMVAGPLHAGVIASIDTGDGWAWIEQNVPTAAGQRAHLEWTAQGDEAFEIVRLVDLAPEGPLPVLAAEQDWWSDAAASGDLDWSTPEARADWLENAVRDASRLVRSGGVPGRSLSDGERAMLLNLADDLVRHHPLVRDRIADALGGEAVRIADLRDRRALVSGLAPAAIDLDGRDERVLQRGDWRAPGAAAPRRAPSALRTSEEPLSVDGEGSGRLEFARALLESPSKTLQRVWVNRLWQALFTVGLVSTPDDFGAMGSKPSHPEILDQLALDFERDGWSTRRILRRLALSEAYARSTDPSETCRERDPENVLLSRMHVRRLEAEEIRDGMLAASEELDPARFGPSIPVHLSDFMSGRGRPRESGPLDGARRRSIYLEIRRNFPNPFLTAFDWPTPATCRGRRSSSNVPAQALALLNDPFVEDRARYLGEGFVKDQGDAAAEPPEETPRLETLWIRVLGRRPDGGERESALAYLDASSDAREAWVDLAHVLFNVKDFLFLR
ncbi:PSD1 and planctomycete cytochrome C domain-containing protein [Saltatorellus ferox]|uniref:PSD1 and planctomycete cytochrome C domain-containing protein n=1 Tax=Saltatorellus ferox TaxID=2528018 RepID=UPI003AF37B2A